MVVKDGAFRQIQGWIVVVFRPRHHHTKAGFAGLFEREKVRDPTRLLPWQDNQIGNGIRRHVLGWRPFLDLG